MKAKVIRSLLGLLTCPLLAHSIPAQPAESPQNRFDLLAKSLSPFLALATPNGNNGNHALDLQLVILEVSGLPSQLKGGRLHVMFEAPDKIVAQGPGPNGVITVGSHDEKIWGVPGAQLQPALDSLPAESEKKNRRLKFRGFHFTAAEAVLLPALLTVRNAGSITVGASTFRVLDVGLMPELKAKGWSARVWIRPENESIAQIALRAPSWNATLLIEKAEFSISLPPETWEPTAEQRADAVEVPLRKFAPLVRELWKITPATSTPLPSG